MISRTDTILTEDPVPDILEFESAGWVVHQLIPATYSSTNPSTSTVSGPKTGRSTVTSWVVVLHRTE